MQITLGTDEKTSSRSFLWKDTFETRAHFAPCFIRKFVIGPKKSVQFGEVTKTFPSTRYFEWMAKESPGEPGKAQESPEETGRVQESPGEPRRTQESSGELRRDGNFPISSI